MADDDLQGSDLQAIIAGEITKARTAADTTTSEMPWNKRDLAGYYMRGEMPDLPARPGGSKQTSRDFADAVAWVHPGVIRVFVSSDQMVQYDKVREENDDWARDASEYTNHSFFRENDGYRILYNATYDGLTQGNGVVCSYWEPPQVETKTFRDQTEMEIAGLLEEGWQPTGSVKPGKPKTDLIEDPMTGEAIEAEVPTMTVRLQKEEKPGKICDATCKPENLLLNGGTTIENARFVAYLHDDKTRSDLMELADAYGWNKETIRNLGADNSVANRSVVGDARDGNAYVNDDSPFRSGDPIELYECYIRYDKNGDGVAELIQAWFAGDKGQGALLSDEEWDVDNPYTDIPCYPVPHRYQAESLFDRTADIARVKTTLLRQGLDNTYWVNLPMREAEESSVRNPDIMVSPKFGGIIWKKPGSPPVVQHVVPYTADKSFAALEYMDEVTAKRTGISRTTMALDPEALQNQTATAAQQQRDAGYSQIELIARNMAELGWARWAKKRLKLAIKHGVIVDIPSRREVEGQPKSGFRRIDASKWDPNMAVSINVGLGTGSRDRDMAMLNTILMGQMGMADRLAAAGMKSKAIEFIPKIRNTAVRIAESSGLKNPEEFYPEFTDPELEQAKKAASQPQPDPAIELEKMKGEQQAQLKQVDAQVTMQVEAGKNQLAMQQAEVTAAANRDKEAAQLQADLQTKAADRDNELLLEEMRQRGAKELKLMDIAYQREKAAEDRQLTREGMANSAGIANANNAARADIAKRQQKNKPKQPNA